jgi:N-acetylglucosaminyldiphosphoundecaprenol N-acetyl-beta-D-mannosaminyltransferase
LTGALVDVPTQRLFGLDFVSDGSVEELARLLFEARDDRDDRWRCVVTPNVDHLVRYRRNPLEADVAARSELVLPDGMPIVWASRLLGRPLAARLTGADLFASLWTLLVADQVPVAMIVAREAVAARLADTHPAVRCIVPPMFDVDDAATVTSLIDEADELCRTIDARFLVVGVSMPKHHLIADRLRQRWAGRYAGTPTVLLLGQSPEFAVGLVRRAPSWMQRYGLEWIWRLADDPVRLAKRYLVDDVRFVNLVWREWRRGYPVRPRRSEREQP